MDRKEKNKLKAEIGKFINLGNGRYKDSEVETLRSLIDKRREYDGKTRTYRKSSKEFDSEGRYNVDETDTYTFRSDDSGIRIEQDWTEDWDDGQHEERHIKHNTGRDILNVLGKLFRK